MATLITDIKPKSFPANLDCLEFESSTPFIVTITIGGAEVYKVTLQPDGKHKASIYSMAELIQTHLEGKVKEVVLNFEGTGPKTTKCYPCNLSMEMDAADFLDTHFLTLSKGIADTYPGSIEYLGVAADAAPSVSILAKFCDADGHVESVSIPGKTLTMTDGIGVLEIRVDEIRAARPEALLLQFLVQAGNRKQLFRLQDLRGEGEHLTFINAFGIEQHIYFPMVETKMQPEKQQARINGRLQNYKIDRKRLYHGAAQIVAPDMEDIYEDFLMSRTICRQRDNVMMVIDSGEVVHTTESSVSGAAKAVWRESSPVAYYEPSREINTFDDTFDTTFQ